MFHYLFRKRTLRTDLNQLGRVALASSVILFVCLILSPGQRLTGQEKGLGLEETLKPLGGGPLHFELDPTAANKKTPAGLTAKAKSFLGVETEPSQAWLVLATDREFMSGHLKNRACWLFLFYPWRSLPDPGKKMVEAKVFVVMDEQTEIGWEVFSLPGGPWWKTIGLNNDKVLERYQNWSEVAKVPQEAPRVSLLKALSPDRVGYFGTPNQVIARYLHYTNYNQGLSIRRIQGREIIPPTKNRAIWLVSVIGIDHLQDQGSQRSSSSLNHQENNYLIDATTGKPIATMYYR